MSHIDTFSRWERKATQIGGWLFHSRFKGNLDGQEKQDIEQMARLALWKWIHKGTPAEYQETLVVTVVKRGVLEQLRNLKVIGRADRDGGAMPPVFCELPHFIN